MTNADRNVGVDASAGTGKCGSQTLEASIENARMYLELIDMVIFAGCSELTKTFVVIKPMLDVPSEGRPVFESRFS